MGLEKEGEPSSKPGFALAARRCCGCVFASLFLFRAFACMTPPPDVSRAHAFSRLWLYGVFFPFSLQVYTWGRNELGGLGHGDTKSRANPTLVAALAGTRMKQASCGKTHTAILAENGEYCCRHHHPSSTRSALFCAGCCFFGCCVRWKISRLAVRGILYQWSLSSTPCRCKAGGGVLS